MGRTILLLPRSNTWTGIGHSIGKSWSLTRTMVIVPTIYNAHAKSIRLFEATSGIIKSRSAKRLCGSGGRAYRVIHEGERTVSTAYGKTQHRANRE